MLKQVQHDRDVYMKNLVIVESPTKARTIGKFLGSDYQIQASMGHVMDLPKSKLGVDVEHNFEPQYELMPDKKKIISELKQAAKGVDSIILATDPDREGEAIAYHVKNMINSSSKLKMQGSKFKRIVFHEITKEAIEEAIKNPREVDAHLVDAQTARRVLDRLVGYKLSPLLWQKVRRGLSAGRVQSIALRLIVEREKEIEKFQKENYWTITAVLSRIKGAEVANENFSGCERAKVLSLHKQVPASQTSKNFVSSPRQNTSSLNEEIENTEFELIEINGEKIDSQNTFSLYDGEYKVTKTNIDTQEKAEAILQDLANKQFIVSDVLQRETKRSPQPPYTTSTLQQDAARRLGLSGKRTMSIAQKLYEEGYITYHRTDSVAIANSALFSIVGYIKNTYGEKYLPQKPRFYATKQKLAQEAHEAIRPTKVNIPTQLISQDLGLAYGKLYELIWQRAVASQMADAVIESTTVFVDSAGPAARSSQDAPASLANAANAGALLGSPSLASPAFANKYRFKANGSVLLFEGFLKVNPQALQDNRLPKFEVNEQLSPEKIEKVAHETSPPPRYNDASLIKTLEEKGIGRPSTYATIISTIEDRRYIERLDKRFVPTSIGKAVNEFLVKYFSNIDDIPFTAEMENELDEIAQGEKDWVEVMRDFYKPFEGQLEKVKDKAERVQIEVEKTNEICPKCGSALVIREGRFGKFFSCSKFPECDYKKSFVEETNLICPKDGGKIIFRKTKRGRKFYGCSNFPTCKYASWIPQVSSKPTPRV